MPKDLGDPKELGSPWELQIPQEAEHPWGFGEVQELETPYRVKHPKDLGISRSWETPGDWKPHREHHITGNLGAEHLRGFGDHQEMEILQGAEHCWGFGDAHSITGDLGTPLGSWGAQGELMIPGI